MISGLGDKTGMPRVVEPSATSPGNGTANFCIRIRLCEKGNARKGHANAAVAAAPARKNCLRLIINLLDKCTRSLELAESGLGGASWTLPPKLPLLVVRNGVCEDQSCQLTRRLSSPGWQAQV